MGISNNSMASKVVATGEASSKHNKIVVISGDNLRHHHPLNRMVEINLNNTVKQPSNNNGDSKLETNGEVSKIRAINNSTTTQARSNKNSRARNLTINGTSINSKTNNMARKTLR